ncbi:MAG: flavodoxin family protein [Eubacteriales bacterium]|nr:flavodoxin family protein [Eubacteriales bacterium]MDD3882811.1 flavodoxin family protein [Eubacteriales bacterium]MDD4513291.1 flavodoxin family protein [Eubacteriales bacterium]
MAHIALLIGSPRRGGNTETLALSFSEGALSAGNTVDAIYASELDIRPCRGCNYCYRSEGNKCALCDDMPRVYERLMSADVIAVASPVYFYSLPSPLKALIDRLHSPIRNSFRVRRLCLLSVCADSRQSVFDSIITMYKSVLGYFSLEDGGIVTAPSVKDKGDILGRGEIAAARKVGEEIGKGL